MTKEQLEAQVKTLKEQLIDMALLVQKLEKINEDAFLRNLEMAKEIRQYQAMERVNRYGEM